MSGPFCIAEFNAPRRLRELEDMSFADPGSAVKETRNTMCISIQITAFFDGHKIFGRVR